MIKSFLCVSMFFLPVGASARIALRYGASPLPVSQTPFIGQQPSIASFKPLAADYPRMPVALPAARADISKRSFVFPAFHHQPSVEARLAVLPSVAPLIAFSESSEPSQASTIFDGGRKSGDLEPGSSGRPWMRKKLDEFLDKHYHEIMKVPGVDFVEISRFPPLDGRLSYLTIITKYSAVIEDVKAAVEAAVPDIKRLYGLFGENQVNYTSRGGGYTWQGQDNFMRRTWDPAE
ncbi:MAG: hypothetical protein AAB036_09475 [Elusimicrobiota bacterium]